jgi:hypothetical protein
MLFCFGISVLLGHAEVDYVDDVGGLCAWFADEEVVGFDVSVDEVLFVDGLDSRELDEDGIRAGGVVVS